MTASHSVTKPKNPGPFPTLGPHHFIIPVFLGFVVIPGHNDSLVPSYSPYTP